MCGVVPQSWQGGRCAPPLHPPREPCAGSSRSGRGVPAPPQDPTQTNGIAVGSRPRACACPLEPSAMASSMDTTKGRSCPLDTRPTVRRLDGRQRFAAGPRSRNNSLCPNPIESAHAPNAITANPHGYGAGLLRPRRNTITEPHLIDVSPRTRTLANHLSLWMGNRCGGVFASGVCIQRVHSGDDERFGFAHSGGTGASREVSRTVPHPGPPRSSDHP